MDADKTNPVGSNQQIPEELIQKLDEANARFHESRERLEKELDVYEPDREHRVAPKREAMQKAEAQIEEVSKQIEKNLDTKF